VPVNQGIKLFLLFLKKSIYFRKRRGIVIGKLKERAKHTNLKTKSMKIKIEKSQDIRDYTIYTVKRVFGKIRITGFNNLGCRHDPTPFFGTIDEAIAYGDREGFDLVSEMEKAGWNTEK